MTRIGLTTPEQPNTVRVVNEKITLDSLREHVGGWIEHVTIFSGYNDTDGSMNPLGFGLYINEEGRLDGLPENPVASVLYRASGATGPMANILGPAVLIGAPDDEGDETDLPEPVIEMLKRVGVEVVREDG